MFGDYRCGCPGDKALVGKLLLNRFKFCFQFPDLFGEPFFFRGEVDKTLQRNESLTQRRHRGGMAPTWSKVRVDFEGVCVYQSREHAEIRRKGGLQDHSHLFVRRNSVLRAKVAGNRGRFVHPSRKSNIEEIKPAAIYR